MEETVIQTMEEKKPGYKKTKLGWIPQEWKMISLKNNIKLESGQHLNPEDYSIRKIGVPYFTGPTDFTNDLSRVQKWTNNGRKFGKKGEILITVKGSGVGKLYNLNLEKVAIGRQLMSIDGINIYTPFLYFLLERKAFRFQQLASGNMIPGLSRNDILSTKIVKPKWAEQVVIANVLSKYDLSVEKTESLLNLKRKNLTGLMQQLLTGKKRLPGFSGEWKEYKLEKFFKERNEKGFDNLPLLSVGEAGVYPQSDSNKKDTSNKDKSKYKRICPGDIGYNTMRLWQGRNALSLLEGIISPAYTVVIPKENAHAEFFKYLFKLPEVVHKFYRNSQGLVSDTLNCKFKDFKIVKVMLPPSLEEQIAIANILLSADEEIELLKKKKDMLQTQKKGLMQQLLTGKKRISTYE